MLGDRPVQPSPLPLVPRCRWYCRPWRYRVQAAFLMQLIAYTSSRPGAIVESNCYKGLSRVLKYKVPPSSCIIAAVKMMTDGLYTLLLQNSIRDGNILVLEVSTTFLKGKRDKRSREYDPLVWWAVG